jgi:hypothetical protein
MADARLNQNKEREHLVLMLSLQSYFGPSCRFEVAGVRARAEKTRDGETIFNKEMELSEQAVRQFAERVAALGVFTWECHYIQCCMLDGTSWTAELTWDGKRVWSTGTNGYPQEWPEFIGLLTELLGLEKDFCQTMT